MNRRYIEFLRWFQGRAPGYVPTYADIAWERDLSVAQEERQARLESLFCG